MKKLFTLAILLACATIGIASAARPPASSMQAGQTTSTVSGTLTESGGKFYVTDDATRTTFEVRGEGLQKYVGKKVDLTGQLVPGSTGSPEILIISEIGKKAAGAVTGGTAAGVKGGLSKAAVIGLAGGGTAATVGSLYASDVIGGSEASVSRR